MLKRLTLVAAVIVLITLCVACSQVKSEPERDFSAEVEAYLQQAEYILIDEAVTDDDLNKSQQLYKDWIIFQNETFFSQNDPTGEIGSLGKYALLETYWYAATIMILPERNYDVILRIATNSNESALRLIEKCRSALGE